MGQNPHRRSRPPGSTHTHRFTAGCSTRQREDRGGLQSDGGMEVVLQGALRVYLCVYAEAAVGWVMPCHTPASDAQGRQSPTCGLQKHTHVLQGHVSCKKTSLHQACSRHSRPSGVLRARGMLLVVNAISCARFRAKSFEPAGGVGLCECGWTRA